MQWMIQEITTYDEVSTIDKDTKLLLTKDGGLGQKNIEEVGNVINGTGDISGIGDGTVKGAIRGLNDELTVIGKCKNLLKPTLQTTTQNGVTCTNNGDGTYTLNGTASADNNVEFVIYGEQHTVELNKEIRLTGCPNNTRAYILIQDWGNPWRIWAKDDGNGSNFKITTDSPGKRIAIVVMKGQTINNLVFKPMLTTNLDATYDDFVPYTGDGNTLTADVAKINDDLSDLIARVTALE